MDLSGTADSSAYDPSGSIVVGVDGSACSDLALDWAVRQAVLEHRPLTVLHSAHDAMTGNALLAGTAGFDEASILEAARVAGHELLDDSAQRARLLEPQVDVGTMLTHDDPRAALLRVAHSAATVVIGSRGRGALASLLLGSVSVTVSRHAACPIVVVRHDRDRPTGQGVLVGIDVTGPSRAAVEFAYRTASARSLPLTAMHVVRADPDLSGVDVALGHRVSADQPGLDEERRLLAEATSGMEEKFPDVEAHRVLVLGERRQRLVEASRTMDLVVVGSRHRGFVNDVVHGSVAPAVVEHAHGDVAVVPLNSAQSATRRRRP